MVHAQEDDIAVVLLDQNFLSLGAPGNYLKKYIMLIINILEILFGTVKREPPITIVIRGLFLKSPKTFQAYFPLYFSFFFNIFPLYFHNAKVVSHQTSQSSCFFLH